MLSQGPKIDFLEISIDFLNGISDLSEQIKNIFSNALAFIILICFAIGVIFSVIGAIRWAANWDEKQGKKSIIKGVVFIGISLLLGAVGLGFFDIFSIF
ncbi:MAG: hypothetical protein ACFFDW_00050 [Candidatus Thorarchaeota archaeon]